MHAWWRHLAVPICLSVILGCRSGSSRLSAGKAPALGVLVGIDGATGHRLFRTETPGPASLSVTFAADGVVVAERRGCLSADQVDFERATVMIAYDARTGRERWHQRAGMVTVGPESGGWAQLTPGVLPVRDVAHRGADGARSADRRDPLVSGRGIRSDPCFDARPPGHERRRARRRPSERRGSGHRRSPAGPTRSPADDGCTSSRHPMAWWSTLVGDPAAASFDAASEVGVAIHILSADDGTLEREIPLDMTTLQKTEMTSVEDRRVDGHPRRRRAGRLRHRDRSRAVAKPRRARPDLALPSFRRRCSHGRAQAPVHRCPSPHSILGRGSDSGCASSGGSSTGERRPRRTSSCSSAAATTPSP